MRYALHLARTSRPKSKEAPESVKKYVARPRERPSRVNLVLGAKARAITNGRYHVIYEDIRAMAHPVLRHRVLTNFRAESEGITTDSIVDDLLAAVAMPRSGM
jgi:MoxR-like ATPase